MAAITALLFCLLGLSIAATIPRNIPVEVRYEGTRNLDAKVQLSPEELDQSIKSLPLQEAMAAAVAENVTATALKATESTQSPVISAQPPHEEAQSPVSLVQQPVESSQPPILGSFKEYAQPSQGQTVTSAGGSLEDKLKQLRSTVLSELQRLRNSFKPSKGESAPDHEQWASLEKAVDELFDQQKSTIYTKQSSEASTNAPGAQNNNIFQNIINGMTQLTSGWVANIQNRPQGAQSDPETGGSNSPGVFQGFVQYFTNGVNNLMNQITNNNGPTTSNTLLGDAGVTNGPANNNPLAAVGGFFSSVATNVQQVFNRPNNSPPGTQGDTGSNSPNGPPSPIQAIQNFGNSVSSAINNIFQGQPPASTSGDEGVPPSSGGGNIIQSIGNAIQNSPLNPFRPQSNSAQKPAQTAPQASSSESASVAPTQPENDNRKKPAEETPIVVEPVGTEEATGDNEIDTNKEKPVTSH